MNNSHPTSEPPAAPGAGPLPATSAAGAPKPDSGPKDQDKSQYRSTLNLPQTAFPMKANLVQNEPASMKRWAAIGVYKTLRERRKGSPRFVFHDGPPYANGGIHLGHLMNKCLKDIVVRAKSMAGMDCPYVPGWDCHGLPIEHKVVSELLEQGKYEKLRSLTEDQRRMAVRRECQKYAEKWVKLQSAQMQRLLTLADYDDPYLTMRADFEGATLEVLASLIEQGLVFRALKPVHWSIANETALAEAELEYYDREDISVYVDFEAADTDAVYDAFGLPAHSDDDSDDGDAAPSGEGDAGADERSSGPPAGRPLARPSFMIWTTTPWTLPANLAIAVNPRFEYALVWVDGNVTVMASSAIERVFKAARASQWKVLATTTGDRLVGLRYRHPFVDTSRGEGVGAARATGAVFTVVDADYVTAEDGTGLVHTAPGHGTEDYATGLRAGLPVYCPVKADGAYDDTVPAWLRAIDIWKANDMVVAHLRDSGHLFFDHKFMHSYPHDWRSKTPVIFRCTEQWFVGVDRATPREGRTLRDLALAAAQNDVRFVPEWGRNRMRGMLESRPDWCISRQRAWGLPIPAFFGPGGLVLMTPRSVRAVADVVRRKGADAWFTSTPAELLSGYDLAADPDAPEALRSGAVTVASLTKGPDILDVWFESGSTWNGVMRERSGGADFPMDLYLEGSDQHRGWFQTSLLTSAGMMGVAPFKALLTHGFIVDKDGKKLSKSRPDAKEYEVDTLTANFGVDVLRWWVSSIPYENDVKVDLEFFGQAGESYRKVRNTLRFMLSNLFDFTAADVVAPTEIGATTLDAWVLHEFDLLASDVIDAYANYDLRTLHTRIYDFCNDTLSAVYLAAVKDRLYCDAPGSPRRRRTQTALWHMTDGLARMLAPIMCHTADEAFRSLRKADASDKAACVHLETFPGQTQVRADLRWNELHQARTRALQAIEQAKSAQGVENPLDMGLILADPEFALAKFETVDIADLLGVSEVTLDSTPGAPPVRVVDLRDRPRCDRSWKRDGTVRRRSDGGMLSDRDAAAVGVS